MYTITVKKVKIINTFEIVDDYVVGKTDKGYIFYFDSQDFDKVKQFVWIKRSNGTVFTRINNKTISLAKYLFNDEYYEFIGENNDFRRRNLHFYRMGDRKCSINGYVYIYNPQHPRASKTGLVYEHILNAEKILGRYIKKNEVVHHIDCNRSNNNPDNLMVFKSKADHTSFHQGSSAIKDIDGTYYCPNKNVNHKKICPICQENYMWSKSNMCSKCRLRKNNVNISLKEELI